jgi:putative oxidoreductase
MKARMPQVPHGHDLAALVLRLVVGPAIAYHGYLKVKGGISGVADFVKSLGIPVPTVTAYAVTFIELVGGLLILVGLLTRLWGLLLAVEMALTTLLVKLDAGLIAAPGQGAGAELDLLYLAGGLSLALMGPGAFSADHTFGIEPPRITAPR